MTVTIPKKLELGGLVIDVKLVSDLDGDEFVRGRAEYKDNEILIQKSSVDAPIQEQDYLYAFWHELVHWILWTMNEDDTRYDEKFVTLFGTLLH